MIDHMSLSVSDFDASKAFYDKALGAIGASMIMVVPTEHTGGVKVGGYGRFAPQFWLAGTGKQNPPVHVAFSVKSHAAVRAFHAAALEAGGTDNGEPGFRPQYHRNYYGAFVKDLDGNNVEAVCHLPPFLLALTSPFQRVRPRRAGTGRE